MKLLSAIQTLQQTKIKSFFNSQEGEGSIFTSLIISLRECYSVINMNHFYDIWRNKLKPINIIKLSINFKSVTEEKKLFKLVDSLDL